MQMIVVELCLWLTLLFIVLSIQEMTVISAKSVQVDHSGTGRYTVLTAVPNTVFKFRGLKRERGGGRYIYCFEGGTEVLLR